MPSGSAFQLDPVVREERLLFQHGDRKVTVCSRKNGSAQLRDDEGVQVEFPLSISDSESIMSELREPHRYPELSELRSVLLGWRFYHQFRTDAESPLRRPQISVRTPALSHDGSDLAAALQTILEIGDHPTLHASVSSAFPKGHLRIRDSSGGMEVGLEMEEFRRCFRASELSDGTLKYLCLLAGLLSPRPPTLLAINEPDANLHPGLYEPLTHLIAKAARHSQLWITTHSPALAELLAQRANASLIRLDKIEGSTIVAGDAAEEWDVEESDEVE
jgi:predicted ATPase